RVAERLRRRSEPILLGHARRRNGLRPDLIALERQAGIAFPVARIADPIPVQIRLIRIVEVGTVVEMVRHAVAVGVRTGGDDPAGRTRHARHRGRAIDVGDTGSMVALARSVAEAPDGTIETRGAATAQRLDAPSGGDEEGGPRS